VTARKPGNVHRTCEFDDLSYLDFLHSAAAIAPVMETACQRRLGETVLAAVRATQQVVRSNTNLGMILLLTPLAAVPREQTLRKGLAGVLQSLDLEDARAVYQAIRLARPGGLGRVAEQDVTEEPSLPLREIMALAVDRDLIARQYVDGFQAVLDDGVPALQSGLEKMEDLEQVIIGCHLQLLARYPDSLITRKRGQEEAEEASRRAEDVLERQWPYGEGADVALRDLDAWLRAEGKGRNPGTTADLVAASLFVVLREGMIQLPLRIPWSTDCDHA
jgi:triphosphoribosyl-dephospho-CoA synthase